MKAATFHVPDEMPETPATWRTFAALLELHRDRDADFFTTKQIARQAGVDLGSTERELERLERVGATEERQNEELEFALTDLPVEETASRLETLDALSEDEYEALVDALDRGDVDPEDALYDVGEAREAADRALGAEAA